MSKTLWALFIVASLKDWEINECVQREDFAIPIRLCGSLSSTHRVVSVMNLCLARLGGRKMPTAKTYVSFSCVGWSMANLGLVQHHEFSMSYLCTHGGGLRRELESGESTVNAFFPKLISKLGVILWFNGFLWIMRWQTKSLHKSSGCFGLLGSIMHESVSCTDALCKM